MFLSCFWVDCFFLTNLFTVLFLTVHISLHCIYFLQILWQLQLYHTATSATVLMSSAAKNGLARYTELRHFYANHVHKVYDTVGPLTVFLQIVCKVMWLLEAIGWDSTPCKTQSFLILVIQNWQQIILLQQKEKHLKNVKGLRKQYSL